MGSRFRFDGLRAGEEVAQWSVGIDGTGLKLGGGFGEGSSIVATEDPRGTLVLSGTDLSIQTATGQKKQWSIGRAARSATWSADGNSVILADRSSARSLDVATGKIETIVSVKEAASVAPTPRTPAPSD